MGKEKQDKITKTSIEDRIAKTEEVTQKIFATNYNARVYSYFLDLIKTADFLDYVKKLKKLRTTQNEMEFRATLMTLCNTFGLDPFKWIDIVYEYVKSGIIPTAEENYTLPVATFDTEKMEFIDKDTFPVMLAISPFASQRDIIEYIKKFHTNHILPIQKRSRVKFKNSPIGNRSKDSSTRNRNDFIYKKRELPRKEIATSVAKEFKEFLDVGHIGKIISEEKKKRENK